MLAPTSPVIRCIKIPLRRMDDGPDWERRIAEVRFWRWKNEEPVYGPLGQFL